MSKDLKTSARRWAWEYMLCNAELPEYAQDDEYRAAQHILATTTPPTMADVEWDNEEHHLAGATLPSGYEVVMMWPDDSMDKIDTDKGTFRRGRLTPNGKHYELREIGEPEQPEHPETLATVEGYENAPHGTVVAEPGGYAWAKGSDGGWWQERSWLTNSGMAGTERDVLREGWGK